MRVAWYKSGLRFSCTDCGECCKGDGRVFVSPDEAINISMFLSVKTGDLGNTILKRRGGRVFLVKKPNKECIFWNDKKCSIYPVRPTQCKTFPFWKKNIESEESWEKTKLRCDGIGSGKLYKNEDIVRLSNGVGGTFENISLPCIAHDFVVLDGLESEAFGKPWSNGG